MKADQEKHPQLYPIGQVARMFDVSVATIRLYESEGLIIPLKTAGKHRLYSAIEIKRISCIRKMIVDQGMNLAGIRMILSAIPCWEIKQCSDEDRNSCAAFSNSFKPCWIEEEKGYICSIADCRECAVYINSSDCTSVKSVLNKYWKVKNDQ